MTSARPALLGGPELGLALRGLARRLGARRPRFLRGERVERPLVARRVRTERLVLRRHRMSDAADWYAIQSCESVIRGLRWPVRDARQSRQHLRDRTRHHVLAQADDFLAYAVDFEGVLIGDVLLHLRDVNRATRSAEIGWVLNPDYTGQGFAAEAAQAALGLAFRRLGATVVFAEIEPTNVRSQGLAKRLGFEQRTPTRHALVREAWERGAAERRRPQRVIAEG
ncbi:GNAT family N-acetyltransferase [Amnibacterium flavum]|uniref:N-acetyltransferase n=1 Tax=Amnibacterium flavum TaxID=2173173 RepID=A0A2V1HNP6_9MICO|nr:GNAT family N-acetyltransferase [Amnibacterium flavum]PVZ94178.1 N-acetyltransferase [Amnibacterium flavum]